MKKVCFLLTLSLTALVIAGCAGGIGNCPQSYSNQNTSRNSGRLTDGYTQSDAYGPQGIDFGSNSNIQPYMGAPTKIVNGSDIIYGANPNAAGNVGTGANGVNGANGLNANGGYDPNGNAYPNEMTNSVAGGYQYAPQNGYYGGPFLGWGGRGAFDDNEYARRAWIARPAYGGRGFGNRRTAKEETTWNRMNPYDHPNMPTRSPRDFFAPNPPSIGP